MKRLFTVILFLMAFVYLLPLFTVGTVKEGEAPQNDTEPQAEQSEKEGFDAKTEVTLWNGSDVVKLPLDRYLRGVVAAEMPASFPEEALKAQALAARTYTVYQLSLYEKGRAIPESHHGAQLCTDHTHCKAYCETESEADKKWGKDADFYLDKIGKAVDDTCGIIATYKGEPIAAVFHSTSSQRTESAAAVWGNDTPYLVSVESPGSESSPRFKGEVKITQEDFKAKMLDTYPEMDFSQPPEKWFKASERSEAGGIIEVTVGGVRVKGTWLRQVLGLQSTNFTYSVNGDELIFATTGYGHGVGMSQYGAKALAEQGKTYDEIIKWYYTGVELTLKT